MFDTSQPSYQRFRKIYAERTRNLVLWVGSGLSTTAGLPTWQELRARLVEEAHAKVRGLEADDNSKLLHEIHGVEKVLDNWLAFERLRQIVGQASYQAAVRDALSPKPGRSLPEEYRLLWRLRINGILTLSLDRFAARAYVEEHRSIVNEMTGHEAPNRVSLVKSGTPFVINLHGILEDVSSWVLTRSELQTLLSNPAYRILVNTIFYSQTVLFIGISADDLASGGLLFNLRESGIDPGQHFWLTNRRDLATDKWAESAGIEIIRYDPKDGHQRQIKSFYDDLRRYVPPEDSVKPVIISPVGPSIPLPSPMSLAADDPEEIRKVLASHADKLISKGTEESLREYADFRARYRRAIHNAWYVSLESAENVIFGYRLEEQIGSGAFARVYRATSNNGDTVALKLLRAEVGEDERMLGCFRRGVRSMQILRKRGVEGMVPYIEAYELPACAVMEFIEGPDLQQAVESKLLEPWRDGLRIMLDTARIVRRGHLLPEQVLHRDLRPPNVMLKGFYSRPEGDWEVVVLDFDLSWHRGATEKSIDVKAATALGYLAPEQVQDLEGISTRSAAVDSFGMGMTMAFVFTGRHPVPGISASEGWERELERKIRDLPVTDWRSLSNRIARLISRATVPEQNRRVDFSEIESELGRIYEAWRTPASVTSAELWAEELLVRCFGNEGYKWSVDHLQGEYLLAGGLSVAVSGDDVRQKVCIQVGWAFSGEHERKNVAKFLPAKADQFISKLKSGAWKITGKSVGGRALSIIAEVPLSVLITDSGKVVSSLKSALDALNF